jgi:predicted metal-dependent phosphotriesterase family hydrolase
VSQSTDHASADASNATVVETVRGPVAPADLGVTLTHEHLFMNLSAPRLDPADEHTRPGWREIVLDDLNAMLRELADISAAGGAAVLEASTAGMGRRPDLLRAVSETSGVHIICVTGIYTREFHPANIATALVEELAAEMVGELNVGIDGSGIRAGAIKLASSVSPLAGDERKAFQAGGRAHVATGTAITTHTSPWPALSLPGGTMGLEQLDLLEAEGVDPTRVIIGHCDLNPQPDHHLALARRGAYVQYDHIGSARFSSDDLRIAAILQLFEHGHGDRVLLSHDLARPSGNRARGGIGRAFALRELVPRLRAAGLGDAELRQILVENPARVLARPGPHR